jgi:hypothetical protein
LYVDISRRISAIAVLLKFFFATSGGPANGSDRSSTFSFPLFALSVVSETAHASNFPGRIQVFDDRGHVASGVAEDHGLGRAEAGRHEEEQGQEADHEADTITQVQHGPPRSV